MEDHPMNHFRQQVEPVIRSKVEEFKLLGYDAADPQGVWACLLAKTWKQKQEKRLHEIVNDILTLSINDFMAYLSMQALISPESLFKDQS